MIGNILRNMRKKAGYTQLELGNLLNMADTTISSYERENSQPSFDIILKIARVCGYNVLFLDKEKNIITVEELDKELDF